MERYRTFLEVTLLCLAILFSASAGAATELTIEAGAHHLGDTNNSTWSTCATAAPEGTSWSGTFQLTLQQSQDFKWLSIDHSEIEGYTDVVINGLLAKRIPRDFRAACDWATTLVDVSGRLFVGTNNIEVRPSQTSSGGTAFDDMGFQDLKLVDPLSSPLVLQASGDHLGDNSNPIYSPCAPVAPSGTCATIDFSLSTDELGRFQTLVLEQTEVENFATVSLNGTELGMLPRDGLAPCDFRNSQFSIAGVAIEGMNSLEICAGPTSSGGEDDDFAFQNVRLMDFAISSASDVPDDQGGWIRIVWSAMELDDTALAGIQNYGLWRRLDAAPKNADSVLASMAKFSEADGVLPPMLAAQAGLPGGWWEGLGSIPAIQLASYSAVVPSLENLPSGEVDPPWTDVVVTAHTADPTVFYVTQIASGVSEDNLAPSTPKNLVVNYDSGNTVLSWDANPETDLLDYVVYRGPWMDFDIETATQILVAGDSWIDGEANPWQFEYRVAARDHAQNVSDPSPPESVVDTVPATGSRLTLRQNTPNPFNPSTVIAYELAGVGHVRMKIFDAMGRLVRILVDNFEEAGTRQAVWDGRDSKGRAMPSGVYWYRLEFGGETLSRKMTLAQ